MGMVGFLLLLFCAPLYTEEPPQNFDIFGVIESKRKDQTVTITFNKSVTDSQESISLMEKRALLLKPRGTEKGTFAILFEKRPVGTLEILSVMTQSGGKYSHRLIAHYMLLDPSDERLLQVGREVLCIVNAVTYRKEYGNKPFYEDIAYQKRIITPIDGREMILIPKGKFMLGSNTGDRDEYPEHSEYLGNYYIDKYEVSNNDFYAFMKSSRAPKPQSWPDDDYYRSCGDLPVLTTYAEAAAYAKWAGKRLPTELEWEKAARGDLEIEKKTAARGNIYPWRSAFDPSRLNSVEFWSRKQLVTIAAKENYERGLLPITSFGDLGASPYGVVNMAGNAMEWTSSWYLPYTGSSRKDPRFGSQYKVVRGGAWFNDRYKVRVTNREIGGAPSLYRDSFAGFRCVKDMSSYDVEFKVE